MEKYRVKASEYSEFYRGYIERAGAIDLIEALVKGGEMVRNAIASVPDAQTDVAYSTGKWTVRQLFQHINDTERIFAYRACALARGEAQAIPGFNENQYADAAVEKNVTLKDLVIEFEHLRAASVLLFKGITCDGLKSGGIVSGNPMTVRAIGHIMVGHALHHVDVLNERYIPLWN